MSDEFVNFQCKCGHRTLEEIMVDTVVTTEFSQVRIDREVDPEDPLIEPVYGSESFSDGHVARYQCGSCGLILKMPQEAPDGIMVDNPVLLVQWLKQYGKPKSPSLPTTRSKESR